MEAIFKRDVQAELNSIINKAKHNTKELSHIVVTQAEMNTLRNKSCIAHMLNGIEWSYRDIEIKVGFNEINN